MPPGFLAGNDLSGPVAHHHNIIVDARTS